MAHAGKKQDHFQCEEDSRKPKTLKGKRRDKFDRRLALSELEMSMEQDQSDRDFDDMRFGSN